MNQNQFINKTMLVLDPIELINFFYYLTHESSEETAIHKEIYTFLKERSEPVEVEVEV